MTDQERYELVIRRSLARLRHMHQQMTGGRTRPNQADITRIAEGILSPVIIGLEDLADSMRLGSGPDMVRTDWRDYSITHLDVDDDPTREFCSRHNCYVPSPHDCVYGDRAHP